MATTVQGADRFCTKQDREADRPRAEDGDVHARGQLREPHRVQRHRERLGKHGLVQRDRVGNLEAARRRNDRALGQRAGRLTGHAHEEQLAAGMEAARQALVARAAGKGRIDGHAVAGRQVLYRRPRRQHGAGTLVAQRGRIAQGLVADAAFEIIMNVGAADADAVNRNQRVFRRLELRLGRVGHFDAAKGGEVSGFHMASLFAMQRRRFRPA